MKMLKRYSIFLFYIVTAIMTIFVLCDASGMISEKTLYGAILPFEVAIGILVLIFGIMADIIFFDI